VFGEAFSARLHGGFMRKTVFVVAALATGLGFVVVEPVAAANPLGGRDRPIVVADPPAACAALSGRSVDASEIGLPTRGAIVQSAVLTPADAAGNPEFCLVTGQVLSFDPTAPPINFELNLPSSWVRRTMQLGGGGFNGTVITGLGNVPGTAGEAAPATPLQRGYATFGGDSGNAVGTNPPGSFGLNAESFANYSGESVKRTRDTAQSLIHDYYGAVPRYQYFAGGSKGGHEGLVAAQRYGDDYDGIIAYYPASQNLRLIYGWDSLLGLAYDRPGGSLNPAERQLVSAAVMNACDGLDGSTDGVVADRHGCDASFAIATLECPGGADTGDDCLSATQIDTLQRASQPVDLPYPAPDGQTQTGPFPVLHGADLSVWMNETFRIYDFFDNGVIRYWYLKDPGATDTEVADFDWVANQAAVEAVTNQYDATDPDIDRFVHAGGKLLMVQGTVDMLVAPAITDPYYQSLLDRYGRRLRNSVRYYNQPGYGHGNGAFNMSWDSLTALDDWVSKGRAPANPVAYDGNTATAGRSMPLCDYPKWPLRVGTGDPSSASSFVCVDDDAAAATRTTLRASAAVHSARHPVTLTAMVKSLRPADGAVAFYDGDTLLSEVPLANSEASLQLPGDLLRGFHWLTARFVPANPATLTSSDSRPVAIWAIRS
jgi:hypothetical protein